MSDDALRELLTSPLDDEPRRIRPPVRAALIAAAGVAAGFLIALAVLSLLDGSPDEAEGAPDPGETTTTTAPAAAAEDGLRFEPAWVLARGDSLFVGVDLVETPQTEPESPPATSWALRTSAGRVVAFLAEHTDPFSPGTVTVEFPASGYTLDDVEALLIRPAVSWTDLTGTWTLGAGELPWRGPAPGPIAENDEVTIRASSIRIADTGGVIEWGLFGASGARAVVEATAEWTVPGSDERRVAVAEWELPGAPLQRPPLPDNAATSGALELFRLDVPDAPTFRSRWWGETGPVTIDSLVVEWSARVYTFADDPLEAPLDDVVVLRE